MIEQEYPKEAGGGIDEPEPDMWSDEDEFLDDSFDDLSGDELDVSQAHRSGNISIG